MRARNMKTSSGQLLGARIVLAVALAMPAGLAGLPARGTFELSPAQVQGKSAVSKEQLAAVLDPLIRRLMKDGDVPGLSLAVVKDGRVLYHGAFGVKDSGTGAPVGNDTMFEAASLSKPVFAYAVAKLVDAGKLDLDTSVSKYLPGDYVDDPRLRLITVRHVLSHTTGFPNWRPDGQRLKIHFAPGERFSYSGEGFVYLQKAVERSSGFTLEALMKRVVFEPLRMTSSSYVWEERFEGRKATGHDATGNPRRLQRPALASSAASLQTTAPDYARFLIAVLEGTGLQKKTAAEILRPQVHVDEGCQNCITKKPTGRISREIGWGLGWGLEETDGAVSLWHWGDNSSGFHCYVVGYPRQKLGVVVFTNGLGGHGIIPEIVEAAVGGRHPSFAWLDYERYDSPVRTWFKDILARGNGAIVSYRDRKRGPGAAFTEEQVNGVGYWLLGKKRLPEAIAVFEMNAEDFPASWNAHDSLAEAYAGDGQKQRAVAAYEKSLALNPGNSNGAEQLRKLRGEPVP
jgi:CubicO group peptidase (beta-lactamase class C family)